MSDGNCATNSEPACAINNQINDDLEKIKRKLAIANAQKTESNAITYWKREATKN